MRFIGGFADTPGSGGPNDNPTGYISPLHVEILDSNIEYTYSYNLILGTLQEIRDWVYAQAYRPGAAYRFCRDRQHWSYQQTSDSGWPVNGRLRVNLNSADPQMWSPVCAFYATNVPKLYIRAAYQIAQPAGRSTAQLFWQRAEDSGFSEARSLGFPIIADGRFRTYELNLIASNSYSGLISWLRLDPAVNGQAGDYADIAWICASPIGANEPSGMIVAIAGGNGSAVISFPTVNAACVSHESQNFLYDLESCNDLLAGSWQGVTGFTNVIGDGTTKAFTNAPSAEATYFRVKVRAQ